MMAMFGQGRKPAQDHRKGLVQNASDIVDRYRIQILNQRASIDRMLRVMLGEGTSSAKVSAEVHELHNKLAISDHRLALAEQWWRRWTENINEIPDMDDLNRILRGERDGRAEG